MALPAYIPSPSSALQKVATTDHEGGVSRVVQAEGRQNLQDSGGEENRILVAQALARPQAATEGDLPRPLHGDRSHGSRCQAFVGGPYLAGTEASQELLQPGQASSNMLTEYKIIILSMVTEA
jgi:hypothetical protein